MLIQFNTQGVKMLRKRKFATFTIDTDILFKFNNITRELSINKSI